MSIDILLSRLEKVRQTGPGRWIARCPSHDDKNPSLSLRQLDDGRVLVHCFLGCSVNDILAAVGMQMVDLFPETSQNYPPERRPFSAAEILRALSHEVAVVAAAGEFMLENRPFTNDDHTRLRQAIERIQAAVSLSGVHTHG